MSEIVGELFGGALVMIGVWAIVLKILDDQKGRKND
jgi:hypothetical protein